LIDICKRVFGLIGQAKKPGLTLSKSERLQLTDATSFLTKATTMQRAWHVIHNTQSLPLCTCGKKLSWRTQLFKYSTFCSSTCAYKDGGVQHKKRETNISRYGSPSPFGSTNIQHKAANTVRLRYNVNNVSQIPAVIEGKKLKQTRKFSVEEVSSFKTLIDRNLTQQAIGDVVGCAQPTVSKIFNRLDLHTKRNTMSTMQSDITKFVQELIPDKSIKTDCATVIAPYHVDIFIPEIKIAIEVNGTFWHSQLSGRDNKYHQQKMLMCRNKGIQLIQISDSDWRTKKSIVESRLSYLLSEPKYRFYGRKCEAREISVKEANGFCDSHHLQGSHSASCNYGLYHEGELVVVMTFSRARFSKQYQYEMVRFCVRQNTVVVGAMSKLVKTFVRLNPVKSIGTYADLKWGLGSYGNAGFKHIHNSTPDYHYFLRNGDTTILFSRNKFQKHKLASQLPNFNPQLTEWENMQAHGYDRIWGCGHALWVWEI